MKTIYIIRQTLVRHLLGQLYAFCQCCFYNNSRACVLAYIPNNGEGFIMERKIRRGDIFYADLPPGVGSEQSGYRPIVVLSNNTGNKHSQTVIAAVITSRTRGKAKLPTHCPITAQQGLGRDSLALLEQIRTIDKKRLKEFLGTLEAEAMSRVDAALSISVGLGEATGDRP
jgi:mRNA interferase MazF